MFNKARFSHLAILVPSADKAAAVARDEGFFVGPAESWEGEGTREIYIGDPTKNGRLLLMEPEKEGSYDRALRKRGPGLHHIAIDVLKIEDFLGSLRGSGWLLQLGSLKTFRQVKTVYLARPGFGGLIEVQERPSFNEDPLFISKIEIPFTKEQAPLVESLGVPELSLSPNEKLWLTAEGRRLAGGRFWDI